MKIKSILKYFTTNNDYRICESEMHCILDIILTNTAQQSCLLLAVMIMGQFSLMTLDK